MAKASSAADQAADSATLTCPLFSMAPELLVDATADRKGTLFVYLNLWRHGSGSLGIRKNSYPSVETQANQCRMDPKDVREARNWLIENGWLLWEERPGSTPIFTILLEQRNPPRKRPTPRAKAPRGRCPRAPLGQTPHPTPGANAPPNKNHLTRTIYQEVEPPLPPSGGSAREDQQEPIAAEPLTPIASPPSPPAGGIVAEPPPPESKPVKHRKPRFRPSTDDVPPDLAAVTDDLLAFWPTRSGQKTSEAWTRMLGQARQIQQDPLGGTQILRGQLQDGIDASVDGKPWQSLKYRNWQLYGTKAGGLVKASGNRRQTQDEAAAAAVAFIRDREARKAAAAGGMASQQTVLCEVIR